MFLWRWRYMVLASSFLPSIIRFLALVQFFLCFVWSLVLAFMLCKHTNNERTNWTHFNDLISRSFRIFFNFTIFGIRFRQSERSYSCQSSNLQLLTHKYMRQTKAINLLLFSSSLFVLLEIYPDETVFLILQKNLFTKKWISTILKHRFRLYWHWHAWLPTNNACPHESYIYLAIIIIECYRILIEFCGYFEWFFKPIESLNFVIF